jgi:hypothetical protein
LAREDRILFTVKLIRLINNHNNKQNIRVKERHEQYIRILCFMFNLYPYCRSFFVKKRKVKNCMIG